MRGAGRGQAEVTPLKAKLAVYHGLPPSAEDARPAVQRARAQLAELDRDLAETIKDVVVGN